jgi:hypothetical protein
VEEYPYSLKLKPQQKVTIDKEGDQVVFAGWHSRYFNPQPEVKNDYFTIHTRFEKEEEVLDSLIAGAKVDMVVDIFVDKKSDYLMLEVPVPSVCSYHKKPQRQYYEAHREYFKDKVFIYYSSLKRGKYTVKIELVPRYTGKVNLNPARMEQMYFPVFYGNNELKEVNIKE